MSSFCRSTDFKNYFGDSATEFCTRAISLTAAFTTHFPEGLRAASSDEVFPKHICLVFCVTYVTISLSFIYHRCTMGRRFQTSHHLNFLSSHFLLSNALGSCAHNTIDYFIILCILNFTRIEADIFVVSFFRNLLVDLILSCNFLAHVVVFKGLVAMLI